MNLRTVQPGDEADLARRIAAAGASRDREAEAALYRALAPRVRLYGLKHLRDAQAAADLMQDVLLMTFERLRRGEVRDLAKIASFVLGACRQSIVDRRRGERRRQQILETYAQDLPQADIAPRAVMDLERLQDCLTRLTERERSVLLMTFVDDSSADEVARVSGITAANARVIRHRGIERLRRCVEGARHE